MTLDPYVDPDSGVLRNRFGIADPTRLGEVEVGLTLAALADLGTRMLPGGYDLVHLRLFHLWLWADKGTLGGLPGIPRRSGAELGAGGLLGAVL